MLDSRRRDPFFFSVRRRTPGKKNASVLHVTVLAGIEVFCMIGLCVCVCVFSWLNLARKPPHLRIHDSIVMMIVSWIRKGVVVVIFVHTGVRMDR